MHERLRHELLGRLAGAVSDHPYLTLISAMGLTVIAIVLTISLLEFQADRNSLLDDDLPWNARYIEYVERFAGHDDLVVVVKKPAGATGGVRARAYVDALAEGLGDEPTIRRVYWGFNPAEVSPAAIRMLPWPQFQQRLAELKDAGVLLRSANIAELIAQSVQGLRSEQPEATSPAQAAEEIGELTAVVRAVEQAASGETRAAGATLAELGRNGGWEYLTSDDESLLLMLVEARLQAGDLDVYAETLSAIRQNINQLSRAMPGIEAGVTGVPAIEAEETMISVSDSTRSSILAVIAIAVVLVIAFHSFRKPLLALGALLMGVAWSFGFLSLAIGHLQILSVVFTVILLGLGIDFGIHLMSRFELIRHSFADGEPGFREAMIDTMQTVGPGIITGAITTAVAFLTTLFTDFKGMAEMGLIASAGILLCLVSLLTVLPALMRLFRRDTRHVTPREHRPIDLHAAEWLMPFVCRPYLTLIVAAVIVLVSAVAMRQVGYDYNLADLLPEGVRSVYWQNQYLEHSERSVWFGASIVDTVEEARVFAHRFREVPQVASVGGVGLLAPPKEPRKLEAIEGARQQMAAALQPGPAGPASEASGLARQLEGLQLLLGMAMGREEVRAAPRVRQALSELRDAATGASTALGNAPADALPDRLARLHEHFVEWRAGARERVAAALSTRPLTLDDLPALGKREAVGEDGRLLLKIYPRGDLYEPRELEPFMTEVRKIDPLLTGTVVQIYESALLMKRSYQWAGVFAVVAVFLLVYLDFQRLADAVLCLLPVGVGFVTMFGAMWLAGFSINLANIIVLPLLFGIGVDAGVHLMHRYRVAPRDHPPGLTAGTGKGILLTGVTTMIGFSSMMLARHRGIVSLGFVVTIGVGLTLLACLTVMPAVLELRNRYHARLTRKRWEAAERRS